MIYTGAQNLRNMRNAKMGVISAIGQAEARPHDLLGKY